MTLMSAGPEFDLSVKFCIASVGELFEYATNKAFGIGYDLFEINAQMRGVHLLEKLHG